MTHAARLAARSAANTDTRAMVRILTRILADSYLLMIKTHVAHWNAAGPGLLAVHLVTERQAADLFVALDEIGERIRALGEPWPDSQDGILGFASLKLGSTGAPSRVMLGQLIADHRAMVESLKGALEAAGAARDPVTADLLVRRLAFHEKAAWTLADA